jgi:CO/xanthine dehydrogenase FAD-binding subunit
MTSRILPEFGLLMPQSVTEAIALLGEHRDRITVMAGGTDLLVGMKSGFSPEWVMSLAEVPGLDYVEFDGVHGLRIGAMASLAEVEAAPAVRQKYPALWKSVAENGTAQTRHVATVVGNLLRASPAGDCCCAALAYGGIVVLHGTGGKREVPMDEFFTGYRKTARRSDELAIELKLPAPANGTVSAFNCMTRTKEDLSKINTAVCLSTNGKRIDRARLAMGCVAATPVRLKKSEALLKGAMLDEELFRKLLEAVPEEIHPIDDVRSSAEYRRAVSGVLVSRTIREAFQGI